MTEFDQMTRRALELAQVIHPVLYGEPAFVQGAVLADLMSLWIAGHRVLGDPEATLAVRKEFVEQWLETVWKLVPASEEAIQAQIEEALNGGHA